MDNLQMLTGRSTQDRADAYALMNHPDPDIELLLGELTSQLAEGVIAESNLSLPTAEGAIKIDLFLMGVGGGVAISTRKGAFMSLDAQDLESHPARLIRSFYEMGTLDVAYHLDSIVEVLQIRHPELFAQAGATNAAVRLRRSGDTLHRYELVATTDEAIPLFLTLTENGRSMLANAA